VTGLATPSTFENTDDHDATSVSKKRASPGLDELERKRSTASCSIPDNSSKTICTVGDVVVSSRRVVSVGKVVTCSSGVVSISTTSSALWEQEASRVTNKTDVITLFIQVLSIFL
jgi:hypothetical protein